MAAPGIDAAVPIERARAARVFLLVVALVLASRLPFLGPGYGSDHDAWRVAWSARSIAASGRYVASRAPGYPVQEMVSALAWRGGPLALAGLTALMSALAAGFFALVFRRAGGRDDVLAAIAFASVPAFYAASVQSLDYAWALAFALGALWLALAGRPLLAGVLAGLAIGSRVTSGAWLVPLAIAWASTRPAGRRLRGALAIVGSAIVVGALAYLPAWLASGAGFLRYYDLGRIGWDFVVRLATVDLWGVPGTIALLLVLPAALAGAGRRDTAIRRGEGGLLSLAWISGLVLFVTAYLRAPYKAFYLLPAVPLVLLLLGERLSRRAFAAVCLALVLSPWVLGIALRSPLGLPPVSPAGRVLAIRGRPILVEPLRGPLLLDRDRRRREMDYVGRSLARARDLPAGSVVVAWEWYPQMKVRAGADTVGGARLVYLLDAGRLRELRARGTALYDLAGAEWANGSTGPGLRESGSRPLDPEE